MKQYTIIICLVVFTATITAAQSNTPLAIIEKMFEAIDNNNNLQGDLISEERMEGGSIQTNHIEFKMSNSPRMIYIKSIEPNKGVEILYNPTLYDEKVYVNPNKLLIPNIKLSLHSKLLLDKRHHSIDNMGFQFLKEVLTNALQRAGVQLDSILQYKGKVQFDEQECFKIELIDPTYSIKKYTVQKGESIFSISRKQLISEYSIIEFNKNIDNFWDISEGDIITIPTSYAPKTTLYINCQNYLPVMQLMEDDNGLFEKYEFKNMKIKKQYANNEFDPDFEAYAF